MIKAILVASVMFVVAPIVSAQIVGVGGGSVGAGITFTAEEQAVVRSWIMRQRIVVNRESVTVGAILPDAVETYPVPNDWGPSATNYRYFYSGTQVYFVEPSTRQVVHMVD